MEKLIFLSILVFLIFACDKEAEVFELSGEVYEGTATITRTPDPSRPCGINGCDNEPFLQGEDFRLRLQGNRYSTNWLNGEFIQTADSLYFERGINTCPPTARCLTFLPEEVWLNYQLEDKELTFTHTDSVSVAGFIQRVEFSLHKID